MFADQSDSQIRCEWGLAGVHHLAPLVDAVVIVDAMSFSTCVSVAVERGAIVYPYRFRDPSAATFAASVGAALAGRRGEGAYSLSPASLGRIPAGTRLVLPSPNGATLSLATGSKPTFAGCLRNARGVAAAARCCGRRVAIVPAGERWGEDDSLRPAFEDLVAAGAIIQALDGVRSPEAEAAAAAFDRARGELFPCLQRCSSGRELAERGFETDLEWVATLDADQAAPVLVDGAYRRQE